MLYALSCLGKSKLKRRFSSKVIKQLHTKLKKIKIIYPSSLGWCIVDKEGQAIAESSAVYGKSGENLSNVILCLRNAAHNYGKIRPVQDDVTAVHIEGDQYVFSFYVGPEHVVAFYSFIETKDMYCTMDFSLQDQEMKALIDELFDALQK